jgi:hypothetical protein
MQTSVRSFPIGARRKAALALLALPVLLLGIEAEPSLSGLPACRRAGPIFMPRIRAEHKYHIQLFLRSIGLIRTNKDNFKI